jgi:site-specific DNA recombinase
LPLERGTALNFGAELEREKISQRTHEHLLVKARRGLNVGGRVFGYDNVEVKDGERRVRVEYKSTQSRPRSCARSSAATRRARA